MATGRVKFFDSDQGWGAIESEALLAGLDAWVHFSVMERDGFRKLDAGDRVELDFEQARQDSFQFRATRARRS